MTNNSLQDLGEVDNLAKLTNITHLSLLYNPITTKEHYRKYVIYRMTNLRVLDYKKIKLSERTEAKAYFKTEEGKNLRKEIASSRSEELVEDDDEAEITNGTSKRSKPAVRRGQLLGHNSEEVKQKVMQAIRNAKTLEEVERLKQILNSGQIPHDLGSTPTLASAAGGQQESERMDQT